LFEAVGVNSVITLDVHNLAAYQNAWRIPTDHLEAKKLFVNHFLPLIRNREVVVVSPDVGGVKRAEDFRQALSHALGHEIHSAFLEKYRSEGVVSGQALIGDVAGKVAIVIDDLVSSGTTLVRAAESCRARGAERVYSAVSHGVFGAKATETLSNPALEKLVVTNTIPPFRLSSDLISGKLTVLDVSELFAEAIRRSHTGGSIVELLEL
jgi:ribose-phosphate pyrophosphokinase